jgi:hypothetical protein
MRFKYQYSNDFTSNHLVVLDEDTDNEVGNIRLAGIGVDSSRGIDIWLFDGKYQTRVEGYDTAVGFLLGVEAVLGRRQDEPQFASKAANPARSVSPPRPTNPIGSLLRLVGGSSA